MKDLMKRLLDGAIILAIIWLMSQCAGCSTVAGLGDDLTAFGEMHETHSSK